MNSIIAYTDGSYQPSKNKGGVGIVYLIDGEEKRFQKTFYNCTNNIMELMAIYIVLQSVTSPVESLEIISDSEYAIGVLTKPWNPKKNINFIKKIKNQLNKTQSLVSNPITFRHVKGHQLISDEDSKYNNIADKLATLHYDEDGMFEYI